MKPARTRKQLTIRNSLLAVASGLILLAVLAVIMWWSVDRPAGPYRVVRAVAGGDGKLGEPFGIAIKGNDLYVSDGQNGKIWLIRGARSTVFAEGLDTPSSMVFDRDGNLIVADSGSHTIKSIDPKGGVTLIAGVEGRSGFADGEAATALFNAPIGVAVADDGRVYVADTYNDRLRVIQNGEVSTLAGGRKGYADGLGEGTKFDTPCGITMWRDKFLIADTGNRRIRVLEADGRVWTLAGSDEGGLKDGLLSSSSFVHPTSIAVDKDGVIFITDGNAIRQISGNVVPIVITISDEQRGFQDGDAGRSRFNRPSGLAIDGDASLFVTDSDNELVRRFTRENFGEPAKRPRLSPRQSSAEALRTQQPPRWPYDPPQSKRDIAGTLGEIRGEMTSGEAQVWFHNGLDIAGAYGETARFVRDEKVLRPLAAENFGTLRELLRMPALGYIHIRLGRNEASAPLGDERFQFNRDGTGKMIGVRVPRGTKFRAGEPIGTLNAMNHVHLIAGPSGYEMNALAALVLPNLADSRPPTIEKVSIFDQDWRQIENGAGNLRLNIAGRTRVVVRAHDQTDESPARRRLGVYRLGYQLLKPDGTPQTEIQWTITFDRMPAGQAVRLVYANGSKSGATGETIFDYIVTNHVAGNAFREDFLDTTSIAAGTYTLRVYAADYFGNTTTKDVPIKVTGR